MNLERHARCDLCHYAARPGCREVARAVTEVEKVLAEATTRAYRHGHEMPPVAFYIELPCWYSARKAKREGTV